jgi:hypothetical protein
MTLAVDLGYKWSMERTIPMTYDRAATAIVQGRRDVGRALSELEVALKIFRRLGSDEGTTTYGTRIDGTLLTALERTCVRLQDARRALEAARLS